MKVTEIVITCQEENQTCRESFYKEPIDELCRFLINKKIVDDISYTKRFTVEKAVMERLSQ